MPLPPAKKKGRKQAYHPDDCGQVSRSLDYVINKIASMELSEGAKKRIRRQMFYVANQFTQIKDQKRDAAGRFLKG
jgi:hypothetical protein